MNLFGGLLGKKRRRSSELGDPGTSKKVKVDGLEAYDIDIF